MLNKKLFILPVTGAALMLSLFSAKSVSAATATGNYPSIVQKLAEKFGLNVTDVQAVFDADRTEHEAEKEKQYESMLDTAVSEGKLTAAQKHLILDKNSELTSQRESNRSAHKDPSTMTQAEKTAEMQKRNAERTALQAWAKNNGIDIKYLMFKQGRHGPMGKPLAPPAN